MVDSAQEVAGILSGLKTRKRALITGVTGQDGSYLAEFLLAKGYEVHGIVRRTSTFNRDRIQHLHHHAYDHHKNFFLHYGDVCDAANMTRIIGTVQPDEIYHLAAQSHVQISFEMPEYTATTDGIGALHILESVRVLKFEKKTRIYNASTSELFGKVLETPQTEKTPFYPRSPYGVSKLFAYWIMKNYREAYGMHVSSGILFNHESERRGENFVSRKITMTLARIARGSGEFLALGNLEAQRDWGYAPEYVEAMWLMLQQEVPEDYVIATGEPHSVREFAQAAAAHVGMRIRWEGVGLEERGVDDVTGRTIIVIDPKYYRPAEVDFLKGDATKARTILGWQPKVTFQRLVGIMMDHDLALLGGNHVPLRPTMVQHT